MSLWHYWLWYTFIVGLTLYLIYMYKNVSFNRAHIRGKRATGERRRLAWSEILICLLPLFWSINIISNAFMYLRVLENSGGYVYLSVQITAYQWGWRYYYGDAIYSKSNNYPVRAGFNSLYSNVPGLYKVHDFRFVSDEEINNLGLTTFESLLLKKMRDNSFNISLLNGLTFFENNGSLRRIMAAYNGFVTFKFESLMNAGSTLTSNSGVKGEMYFCRFLLRQLGIIDDAFNRIVKNQKYQPGYWVASQGVDANTEVSIKSNSGVVKTFDYQRLFRTTGAVVLPSRVTIRLMSCSDDITHSWAVPGLGIKIDCVPGRLFCIFTNILREDVYFGQCSELCGWNHYNMPISVYALGLKHFMLWWELELHLVFNDFINKGLLRIENKDVRSYFLDDSMLVNYSLLNWKLK